MAVNRFLNPQLSQYQSQFVPTQLPYELILGQLQQKQKEQNQAKADIAGLADLQAVGRDKVVDIYGREISIEDRSRSQRLINDFNSKLSEIVETPKDLTTGEMVARLQQLKKEYNSVKQKNQIYDLRDKAISAIEKERKDAGIADFDYRGLPYQQRIDALLAEDAANDPTYIPGTVNFLKELDVNKSINDMFSGAEAQTLLDSVYTNGKGERIDINAEGRTSDAVRTILQSGITNNAELQNHINAKIDFELYNRRLTGDEPMTIKYKNAKGKEVEKEVTAREFFDIELQNGMANYALAKYAYKKQNTSKSYDEKYLSDYEFERNNPFAMGTQIGAGVDFETTSKSLASALSANKAELNSAQQDKAKKNSEFIQMARQWNGGKPLPTELSVLNGLQDSYKNYIINGKVDVAKLERDLGIKIPTDADTRASLNLMFNSYQQIDQAVGLAKQKEAVFEEASKAREQILVKKGDVDKIVSQSKDLDKLYATDPSKKQAFAKLMNAAIARGQSADEFVNSLPKELQPSTLAGGNQTGDVLGRSSAGKMKDLYNQAVTDITIKSKTDESYALTYIPVTGGYVKKYNESLINTYKNNNVLLSAKVANTDLNLQTLLTNEVGKGAANTAKIVTAETALGKTINGRPVEMVTIEYKDGSETKRKTIAIEAPANHDAVLMEAIAQRITSGATNSSIPYTTEEKKMLSSQLGQLVYGQQIIENGVYTVGSKVPAVVTGSNGKKTQIIRREKDGQDYFYIVDGKNESSPIVGMDGLISTLGLLEIPEIVK